MELLARFLPLIKIGLVFAAMLAGIRLRLGLWLSILAGSLLLALLFGMSLGEWALRGAAGAVQEKALLLAGIVGLIMVLSELMETSGQAERMMEALRGYLQRPRLRLVFFPALIGLLPMPGGAVFSAPMVRSASRDLAVSDEDRSVINYWFRHVWEMCWPLYPGILLASALAGVPVAELLAWLCPGTLAAIALGWFFLLRPLKPTIAASAEAAPDCRAWPALRESSPILTAIAGSLLLEGAMNSFLPAWPMELGVLAGLLAAVVVCAVQNRLVPRRILPLLARKHLYSMLLIIVVIFVFKETLGASGAVDELSRAAGAGTALLAAAVLLPLLTGLVAGITIAFVGASFPLLMGMLEQLGMSGQMAPYVVLAMFAGFSGVMASPLHACFLLSCQYFKVELGPCWRRVLRPAAGLAVFGGAYALVLMAL
jgi:hypothetical protein